MPIEPMEFMKYDKISDDVYTIGPNVILRFNVSLSKISMDNKRYHFYKEFEYNTRAQGIDSLVTVKRTFDYYLSIENVQKDRETDDKAFIRIGVYDIYKLKGQLDTVISWFTDKKYKNLYVKDKGKLILTNPIPDSTVGGYPQNKYLRFYPTILDKGEGIDKLQPGVLLELSSVNNCIAMTFERFMGLYYTISNFNMYLAAQNLVGYLGFQPGLNRMNMSSAGGGRTITVEDFGGITNGINERTIGKSKNISSLE